MYSSLVKNHWYYAFKTHARQCNRDLDFFFFATFFVLNLKMMNFEHCIFDISATRSLQVEEGEDK